MDNRTIDVVSEGDKALGLAISLIWSNAVGGKATHYKIVRYVEKVDYYGSPTSHHYQTLVQDENGKQTLILLWGNEHGSTPLPYPLDLEGAVHFVQGWLKNADYGHEPDHDGNNGHGWRVFTENWGHVAGHHYAIAAIQPEWAMYGK